MRIRLLILLALLSSPSRSVLAQQQRWFTVLWSPAYTISVDTSTVAGNNGEYTAWVRWQYSTKQKWDEKRSYISTLNRRAFDCDGRRIRSLRVAVYGSDGRAINEVPAFDDDAADWVSPLPESRGEAELEAFCSNFYVISGAYAMFDALYTASMLEQIDARDDMCRASAPGAMSLACAKWKLWKNPKTTEAERSAIQGSLIGLDSAIGRFPLPRPSLCRPPNSDTLPPTYVAVRSGEHVYCRRR